MADNNKKWSDREFAEAIKQLRDELPAEITEDYLTGKANFLAGTVQYDSLGALVADLKGFCESNKKSRVRTSQPSSLSAPVVESQISPAKPASKPNKPPRNRVNFNEKAHATLQKPASDQAVQLDANRLTFEEFAIQLQSAEFLSIEEINETYLGDELYLGKTIREHAACEIAAAISELNKFIGKCLAGDGETFQLGGSSFFKDDVNSIDKQDIDLELARRIHSAYSSGHRPHKEVTFKLRKRDLPASDLSSDDADHLAALASIERRKNQVPSPI